MERFSTIDIILTSLAIILILTWLAGVSFYLIRLLKKYTFGDWGLKENPYKSETLGLPRGTLRGVLTLTLLVVVVVLVCASMVVQPLRGGFDSLIDAFQVMLAFYFGSKVMHHVTNNDKKKAESKYEAEKYKAQVEGTASSRLQLGDAFNKEGSVG